MQFIPAVFVIQIPDYHQLGESCGVAGEEPAKIAPPVAPDRGCKGQRINEMPLVLGVAAEARISWALGTG